MRYLSKKNLSLRIELLTSISLSLLVICAVVTWFAYDKGVHEASELMDGQLALSARLLDGQLARELSSDPEFLFNDHKKNNGKTIPELIGNLDPQTRSAYEQELAFQVWSESGELKLLSDNAELMPRVTQVGYHDLRFNELDWRIYTKKSFQGNDVIQVAHPLSMRNDIGLDVAMRVTIPLFFALPVLLFIMYLAVTSSLQPLKKISVNLSNRRTSDFGPVTVREVPKEILPIIHSFNHLLRRVSNTVDRERHFTSDAAHELRTPLAGIKLYAQLAMSAADPVSRERFLSQVLKGIARQDRLIDQMLCLARLDPEDTDLLDSADLIEIKLLFLEAQDSEAFHLKKKEQTLVINVEEDAFFVNGIEHLLLIAITNLISNASRYAPAGTEITLGSTMRDGHHVIYVQDQGPGVSEIELPHIEQRFKRGSNATVEGSGLGLAIVKRIAEIHKITLTTMNLPVRGFRAELSWNV